MGYTGLEFKSQDDYIFSDVIPHNPDFDLEELKIIETKLEDFTSGKSVNGLTSHEAEVFLDWITFNARSYAVKNTPESPLSAPMSGQCAPTQRINVSLLKRFGLDARPFNTSDCIGEIPLTETDRQKVAHGWFSPAVRHSVSLVNIPIMDNSGYTQSYKFLLDPTFRQFCLKENCNSDKFFDEDWLSHEHAAPHPGYFLDANNLAQLGVPADIAGQTQSLGQYLISKGYFRLNEETAKLYGDVFVRASERIEFQGLPINMSGSDYLRNFENIPMHMFSNKKDDEDFLKLPSEIASKKTSIFSKIKNFFQEKFGNKTKMLPSGNTKVSEITSTGRPQKLKWVELTPEQYREYEEGTIKILDKHNENSHQSNIPSTGDRSSDDPRCQ